MSQYIVLSHTSFVVLSISDPIKGHVADLDLGQTAILPKLSNGTSPFIPEDTN